MAITKTEIQSASVARGVDKATHEVFYVVKSDSDPNTWYEVRWNNERTMWCCECPASCSGCKHNRAVQEVLKLRRATIALAMGKQPVHVQVAAAVYVEDIDDPFFHHAPKGSLTNFANRREIKTEHGVPMR